MTDDEITKKCLKLLQLCSHAIYIYLYLSTYTQSEKGSYCTVTVSFARLMEIDGGEGSITM